LISRFWHSRVMMTILGAPLKKSNQKKPHHKKIMFFIDFCPKFIQKVGLVLVTFGLLPSVIRNLNARIANEQVETEDTHAECRFDYLYRAAKYTTLDRNGRKLIQLWESFNLTVLNGGTSSDQNHLPLVLSVSTFYANVK